MKPKQCTYFSVEYSLIIVITLITCALTFISYRILAEVMLIILVFGMAALVFLWRRKLTRNSLYLNNILNLFVADIAAYFLIRYVAISIDTLIGFIAGVAAIDVLSFTKHGKNTPNAKLMSNINTIARLSICLPVPGKPGLQPIIGVGDLLYYSVITMYYVQTGGALIGFHSALFLIAGQILNIIGIMVLKKCLKEQYKGFPATLFPGILIIIANCIQVI